MQRVYAALDVSRFAKLEGDGKIELDFDLVTDTPLATTRVEAGASVTHSLVAQTAGSERIERLSAEVLTRIAGEQGLPRADRERVRTALGFAKAAEKLDRSVAARENALVVAGEDLERLRKDLAALGAAKARARTKDRLARKLAGTEAEIDAERLALAGERLAAGRAWTGMRLELERLD